MTTEAEIGATPPQARGRWRPPESGRGSVPRPFGGGTALPTPGPWASSPRNDDRISFCGFKPPEAQVLVTTALGLWRSQIRLQSAFREGPPPPPPPPQRDMSCVWKALSPEHSRMVRVVRSG